MRKRMVYLFLFVASCLCGLPSSAQVRRPGEVPVGCSAANPYAKYNTSTGQWECDAGPAGSSHNFLSATHTDTTAAAGVLGDLVFFNTAWTKLAGNITTTRKFLRQTGDGAASAAPAWDTLLAGDLPSGYIDALTDFAGALCGTNQILEDQGASWACINTPGGGANHNLLSATHPDTTAAAVVRGDLIAGIGVTPTWQRVAIAISGRFLRSNGTEPAWSAGPASGTGACGANTWASTLNDDAAPTCTQPAFSNLSGTATRSQLPAALVYDDEANTYGAFKQDFGGATLEIPNAITLPGTCVVGEIFHDSDAAVGARFFLCTSLNTFTAVDNPFGTAIDDAEISPAYSGTGSCTNQFARTLNRNAAPTCATVAKADAAATFVHTDQANTWTTGAQDMGAATSHKVPVAAGAAPTVSGNIAYDSTLNAWVGGTNGATENLSGWEYLGSAICSAACASTSNITIAARKTLMFIVIPTGYSGAGGIVSLRFNADSTTTNYHSTHINFSNAATPALTRNNFTASGHIVLGPTAITNSRMITVHCTNIAAERKICVIAQQAEATAQGTIGQMDLAYGEWFNTAAQITSVQMVNNAATNFDAGSGFIVFGRNF